MGHGIVAIVVSVAMLVAGCYHSTVTIARDERVWVPAASPCLAECQRLAGAGIGNCAAKCPGATVEPGLCPDEPRFGRLSCEDRVAQWTDGRHGDCDDPSVVAMEPGERLVGCTTSDRSWIPLLAVAGGVALGVLVIYAISQIRLPGKAN
jgi:hypothetical protein